MKRKEDLRFVTGTGRYVDDVYLPRMQYAAILRSPYAHARIVSVDVTKAERLPGVTATVAATEVEKLCKPFFVMVDAPLTVFPMAVEKARYVGEPVAAVAAESRSLARDAIELIDVHYEPLPAVVNVEEAIADDAPILHENLGSNIVWQRTLTYGDFEDAFRSADKIISKRFLFHRVGSVPIETYGCIANYDRANGLLTLYYNGQIPAVDRSVIGDTLKIPEAKIRLIVPDVGGAFGCKCDVYPYAILTSLLSMKCGLPVKWIEDRREHLAAAAQASERLFYVDAAVKNDGRILGLKVKMLDDEGAYVIFPEPVGIIRPKAALQGCYELQGVQVDMSVVVTNKSPTGPNRGYGCQHDFFMLERIVDSIARKLALDPAEVRFRNFIPPNRLPYTSLVGSIYDSGNYPEALRRALELVDYRGLREEQRRLWNDGRYLGIGISTIVEPAATSWAMSLLYNPKLSQSGIGEAATVKIDPSGEVTVLLGTTPQGQGHQTAVSQLVADELTVRPEDVRVMDGFDSSTHPWTYKSGAFSSKFSSAGIGATLAATKKVRDKLYNLASFFLEKPVETIELVEGRFRVKGDPQRALTIREIASKAHMNTAVMRPEIDTSLEATVVYNCENLTLPDEQHRANWSTTFGNSANVAVVEVDPDSGHVHLSKYVAVHDCGTVINPMIVEGQIHGGVLQGISTVLYESSQYGPEGQMLNPTLIDYALPTASEAVDLIVDHMVSPSPFTPIGAKGMGEGPTMAAPAAIANAIEDALTPFSIELEDSYLPPHRIWKSLKGRI